MTEDEKLHDEAEEIRKETAEDAPELLAEFRRLHESLRGDALHNAAAAIADMIRA